jgi:hypothetical protein
MIDDLSRPVATNPDSEFTLSIDEALTRYARAGLPRTPRSVQRYCAKGHLDCRRVETSFGEKYLITPTSVDKHIAYIEEVRPVATGRDESRHAATDGAPEITRDTNPNPAPTSNDLSRLVATEDKYVAKLEHENEFLRQQVGVKDTQIQVLQNTVQNIVERDKETNVLMQGFQRLFTSLIDAPKDRPTGNPSRDHADPGSASTQNL